MDKLQENFGKLLRGITSGFYRYMYDKINWNSRMIGLTGPRGVGKTTMVLQYIKENLNVSETLYVTAEDFYFAEHKLVDLADTFVKKGGKNLFIDEIHKYNNWARELKLIYDYHPELKVVFTGSSVLDINKGASDLSRRAVMYHMQGLSFREYLKLFHNISL
ncbi:MAG: AAA family ATPase, partial [Rikenellaceae bacterium]